MVCANCGQRGEASDRFCASCGAPLPVTSGSSVAVAPVAGGAGPAPVARPGQESRLWAIGAHLSALVGGFMGGVPAFLGPLVVWLVRKDVDPFAAANGRAALNFNLSVLLYAAALIVITIITFGLGAVLTAPAGILLAIAWFVLTLAGALRAANDGIYRYPLTIPFVR